MSMCRKIKQQQQIASQNEMIAAINYSDLICLPILHGLRNRFAFYITKCDGLYISFRLRATAAFDQPENNTKMVLPNMYE